MSLRRKLTLFFVVIVMLPLIVAAVVVQRVVVGEVEDRASLGLQPSLNSVLAAYNGRAPYVDGLVETTLDSRQELGRALRRGGAARDRFLDRSVGGATGVDFIVVADDKGRIIAFEATSPRFARDFKAPTARTILDAATAERGGPGFVVSSPTRVDLGRRTTFTIAGGMWVDARLLSAAGEDDVEVSLVSGQQVVASTERDPAPAPAGLAVSPVRPSEVQVLGSQNARAQRLPFADMAVVASVPEEPIADLARQVLLSEIALLLLTLLMTALLAYWLARLITRPLEDLSAGAEAVAQGRFDYAIPVRSRDEVGQVAVAFNHMTDRLRETIDELSSSRDQLQRAVRRVGDTLRSTHDMKHILESILNTGVDAAGADAGVLWVFTSTRDELYPAIASGVDLDELQRISVGAGVVGLVAERATPVVGSPGRAAPRRASAEPDLPVVLAIPFYSEDRITGVISLYRAEDRPFTRADHETVLFLAEQGGVAIENVLLHEEAQRLSITDGLTGVWNRRYLQMQFRQVLATSIRFGRPFSVLMLDLDNFKDVNDTYGHQRGDAILIEFAQRVSAAVREVDTFARYGGEEFLCLLSETDVQGALTTAEKIRDVIRSQPFAAVGEDPVRVTTSIGLASYPDHGASYQVLVEAADRALYVAKQEGKDRVRVAEGPTPPLKLAT